MAKGFCHFADFATKRLYHIPRCRNRRLQTSFLKSLLLDPARPLGFNFSWFIYCGTPTFTLEYKGEARRFAGVDRIHRTVEEIDSFNPLFKWRISDFLQIADRISI